MSDYIWVSNLMNDSTLVAMTSNDLGEADVESAIAGAKALKTGHPVPRANLPKAIFLDEGVGAELPPVLDANGFYVVNARVAAILSRHDLGSGALHPVEIRHADRKTPVAGDWFCWVFGNRKSAFSKQASKNVRDFGPGGSEWAKMPFSPSDFDISVTSAALEGPDVWIDPPLFKSIFLGKELGDALASAGLGKAMRLTRAQIV